MSLLDLLLSNGDQHFTPTERDHLRSHAAALELAARVSASIEECESVVVEDVLSALKERYPRFGKLQPQAWERLGADLQLVLRHDVRALALDDPRRLDDAVLCYLRSIYGGLSALTRISAGVLHALTTAIDRTIGSRTRLPPSRRISRGIFRCWRRARSRPPPSSRPLTAIRRIPDGSLTDSAIAWQSHDQ